MRKFILGLPLSGVDDVIEAIQELGMNVHTEYEEEYPEDSIIGGYIVSTEWEKLIEKYPNDTFVLITCPLKEWSVLFSGWVTELFSEAQQNIFKKLGIQNPLFLIDNLFGGKMLKSEGDFERDAKVFHNNLVHGMSSKKFFHIDIETETGLDFLYQQFGVKMEEPEESMSKSFSAKLIRFWKERQEWIKAGRPIRTEKRIEELYDDFCKPCPFFQNDSCGKCGCRIKRKGTKLNKLAWATTRCPDGRWESDFTYVSNKENVAPLRKKRGCCGS
jgi:hypothetical protein